MTDITAVALERGALTGCLEQAEMVKVTQKPEKKLVDSLSQQQQRFNELFQVTEQAPQQLTDPGTLLAIQQGIVQATVTVELAAKVAGSLTQSVNRLATIQ
ncbi:MAG: type III secretion system inner rod subunit SctI [Candidatus Symbiodolus clandestinus]